MNRLLNRGRRSLVVAAMATLFVLPMGANLVFAQPATRPSANAAPDTITMVDPGQVLSGGVALDATTNVAATDTTSVQFEASPEGANTWTAIASGTGLVLHTSFDTTSLRDGLYDLRVTLVETSGATVTSGVLTDHLVLNTSPLVTLDDPGLTLRGTVRLNAGDPQDRRVTHVLFQQSPAGLDQWTSIHDSEDPPFTADFDSTTVADGLYDFRIVPEDDLGHTYPAIPVRARRIDNTAPTASLDDPGTTLQGRTTLSATASDTGSGVTSVRFERAHAGSESWAPIATSGRAPYVRAFDTTKLENGAYDLRVVATDAAGNTTTSAAIRNVQISNPVISSAPPPSTESFSPPARDVVFLGTIAGSPQHETWAYGFTSSAPAQVGDSRLPYTAIGRQLVLLKYTDDAGWRIEDVLRNGDGSAFNLVPADEVSNAGVGVSGAMTASGEAWIWLSESNADPTKPSVTGLFHRSPGGRFVFDPTATQALGPGLLATVGKLQLGQTPGGSVYGMLVAPRQQPQAVQLPGPDDTTIPITEALDYGQLTGDSWSLHSAPLPTAYASAAGDQIELRVTDLDGPGSGWGALFVTSNVTQTAARPLLLGRLEGSSWSYAPSGLDALDLTGSFADPKASVIPSGIKADSSGVWIEATHLLNNVSSSIVAHYDGGSQRVTHSWCTLPNSLDACDDPLDTNHPATLPTATFDGPDGQQAIALTPNFINIFSDGDWSRVPAPGFGGSGAPALFTAIDEAWLPGEQALGHWSTQSPPPPLAPWSLTTRSPITSIALPPGSSARADESGALAVGLDGTTVRYDAAAGWQIVPSPSRVHHINLLSVAFTGGTSAFAVGQFGAILHWDGTSWTEDPASISLTQNQLNSVAFASNGQGWAVGNGGTILHYDGTQWGVEAPPPTYQGAAITSVTVAGGDVFAVAGGDLITRQSDGTWVAVDPSLLPSDPAPQAGDLRLVSGLPDGGVVVAGLSTVLVREQASGTFEYSSQPIEGIPVALAAFRDGAGAMRAMVSVSPPVIDPITFTVRDVAGFPAGDGELLRETSVGWEDLSRSEYAGGPTDLPGDGAMKSDPVLAVASSPDGTHAWVGGGYAGTISASGLGSASILPARLPGWRTASMQRYDSGGSTQSPALSQTTLALPAAPSTVSFAYFSGSMCRIQCSETLDAQPDVNLQTATAQIASYAAQPGGPAFAVEGGDARGPIDGDAYNSGSGALDFQHLPDLLAPLGNVPLFAALGARDTVPGLSDPTQPWADALANSSAPFGSGPPGPGISPVASGGLTGAVHRYYSFDATQNGGVLRVIVLDNSKGTLDDSDPGQQAWLNGQLADVKANQRPAIVVAALPLRGTGIAGGTASDGAAVAAQLVDAGVLAVFTTNGTPQLDEHYLVPESLDPDAPLDPTTQQIPEYEGASLGYQQSGNNGVMWYFVSVDTTNRVVNVNAVPIVDSLALKPDDGLATPRSQTLRFEAIGRRPNGTIATTPSNESFPGIDNYVTIPAASCSGRPCIQPSYSFTSSAPDVADFVTPSGPGSRFPKLDSKRKPIKSSTSGLLCAFNSGTTIVSVTTGLITYSLPVTVSEGGFGPPCGTTARTTTATKPARQTLPGRAGGATPPAPAPAPALQNTALPLVLPLPPKPAKVVPPPAPVPPVPPVPFLPASPANTFATQVIPPPLAPPAIPVPPPLGGTAQAPSAARREEKARKHALQSSSSYSIRPAGTTGSDFFLGSVGVLTILALMMAGAGVRPGPRRKTVAATVSDTPWQPTAPPRRRR